MTRAAAIFILFWETASVPRTIDCKTIPRNYDLPMANIPSLMDYQLGWSRGWLVETTEIRLRLTGTLPINLWAMTSSPFEIRIRCLPADFGDIFNEPHVKRVTMGVRKDPTLGRFLTIGTLPITSFMKKTFGPEKADESDPCFSPHFATEVLVAKLDENNCFLSLQMKHGMPFRNGQHLTFSTGTTSVKTLGFRIEFYIEGIGCEAPVGFSCLLPVDERQTVRTVPIFNRRCEPVGQLTVDCLLIAPSPDIVQTMKVSYQSHWRKGHKYPESTGKVLSSHHKHKRFCTVDDNTLAALAAGAKLDVEFIEFHVQLCQDMEPVVYHEFFVLLCDRSKASTFYKTAIKDLSQAQLQNATMPFRSAGSNEGITDSRFLKPFPTLQRALSSIEEHIGFFIEVKFPQALEEGDMEVTDYFDRDTTIEKILHVIFKYGGDRKIVFSSLDPDTCIVLQKKQNRFPVVFKTRALCKKYPGYHDFRTKTHNAALHFAVAERFLGVILPAEEVVKNIHLVRKAHKLSLVVFVWDDMETSKEALELFRRYGVSAVQEKYIVPLDETKILGHSVFQLSENLSMQTILASQLIANSATDPRGPIVIA